MLSAETKWRRLRGFKLLADVVRDVRFIGGMKEIQDNQQVITQTSMRHI